MPEATRGRSLLEQEYFQQDTKRTAEFLGLPYAPPDPSPIQLESGSVWIASEDQPRIEQLYRLFVGANRVGSGLAFLDVVVRGLWNGTNPGWDKGTYLQDAMMSIGLDHDTVLADTSWASARDELNDNHLKMLEAGHWGVPLMAFEGEPFYGQDRFAQLLWRMRLTLD